MPVGQMTQNSEKVCHSAYRKSVGKMLHRQKARRQNEMSPYRMTPKNIPRNLVRLSLKECMKQREKNHLAINLV
jgi:hypothetical protein